MNVEDIINEIEKFAPLDSAQDWDNSGWQINLGNKEVNKIMLCLSVTQNIIEQAIEQNCDLIISHHPLIFPPIRKFTQNSVVEKTIILAIKNNIQIYASHTNLDIAKGGVNDTLCEKFGVEANYTLCDGFVKIANLTEPIDIDSFILKLKISLNTSKIKMINPDNKKTIQTVAFCSGAGGSFVDKIENVDAYITGDIKYHDAINVQNMILIDAGHFETERIVLQALKNILEKIIKNIVVAKEKEPWVVI